MRMRMLATPIMKMVEILVKGGRALFAVVTMVVVTFKLLLLKVETVLHYHMLRSLQSSAFSRENTKGWIHKCYIAKRDGTDFNIWGSGSPLRQFIYSEDLAELTIWTMRNYHSPDPIILSVGEEAEVSIADVARMVAAAMDFQGQIVFDATKSDGQFKKTASTKKLMSLHPDYKFTSMRDGIEKSCKWFMENYDMARKGY